MYVITWPLWVTILVILAGLMVLAVGVNPYSPLVRHVLARRGRGDSRWIWIWPVLSAVIGLVLIVLALLFRPQ